MALRLTYQELEQRVRELEAERKRAEEEKQKLEAQLRHAQKMEAIGTLAGGIAHDFNNLLMGIQGRVSLMHLNADPDHPDLEHLRSIEAMVQRGAELTRQLLGFARGGKHEVKLTNLNDLIAKSSDMFGRARKEIVIHRTYQEHVWMVKADQTQIDQVLLNLYVNAWQAMPGGGHLYLSTENIILDEDSSKPFDVNPGKYVRIMVTDTGIGMDQVTMLRIFEPFFTTKEMGRGTGLGLSSAYGIITNHGGFIHVYSEVGCGSTFSIYLPATEEKFPAAKPPVEQEAPKGKETILLVDDEEMIREMGEKLLESLGYKVIVTRSGKEAVKMYKKHHDKIAMIILDMIMSGMGGREIYRQLKEINPEVKVLLSSGYSLDDQALTIMDFGCHGFIQKPFNMKDLSKKIHDTLK